MEEAYELLEYLPLDDIEVNDYVSPLFKSASITYEKEEYQFSYFALHLIFMTNIYSTIWKVEKFFKERYDDSLLFARPYNGSEEKFKKTNSVFKYSFLPEKDVFELFSLIGVDKSYIRNIKDLIDTRNEMAHATGKFQILTVEEFNVAIKGLLRVSENIQTKLNLTIREWYMSELLQYAKNKLPENYPTPLDYINDAFLNNYSFSKKDLLACNDFGISRFRNKQEYPLSEQEINRIKEFHSVLKEKYAEITG